MRKIPKTESRTKLRLILSLWKQFVSPLLGTNCRFYPSCSEYFVESLETHGLVRGLMLGTKRLLRCNSLFAGGLDSVPPKQVTTPELKQ